MPYRIEFSKHIDRRDIKKISRINLLFIRRAIEEKLTTHPEIFGKPLRTSLQGCWSLRVDDYRIVYRIEEKTVRIYVIADRSTAYKEAQKRLW